MLGKLSFALALVAAVDAFKLEPVTNMAQLSADAENFKLEPVAEMAQLNADAVQDAPVVISTPGGMEVVPEVDPVAAEEGDTEEVELTTTTTEETEDGVEDGVEEETVPEPEESTETDKPAGSINLTVSMGAAIALLVTSAF